MPSNPPSPNRRVRRSALVLAGALALTGALSACGSDDSAADAAGDVTLNVGFITTTAKPSGPEGWAQKTGTLLPGLDEAGVASIKWLPFKNGPDLSAAVKGGSVDLALFGDTPAITARSTGIDTRLVNINSLGLDSVVYGQPDGPDTLKELDGKKVSIQVGSYYYRYLLDRTDDLGIKPEISHVYVPDALAALKSGGIDAYVAPAGAATDKIAAAGFKELERASEHDLVATSLTVITEDALERLPDLPQAWNKVRAEAVEDLVANADEYYAFAAEATGTTPEVVETWLPVDLYVPEPLPAEGLEILETTEDFLLANDLIKKAVDIEAWQVPQS